MKKKIDWEEVPGLEYWKAEKEGETIQGVLIKKEKNDLGNTWTVLTEKDEEIKTPSHSLLQQRLEKVMIGTLVRIEYKGERATKQGMNPVKIYKVLRQKIELTDNVELEEEKV